MIEKLEATPGFTSLREKGKTSAAANQRIINGCNVPDSLIEDNPDFFSTLDENGVIRVSNYYYRYDYCNDKVWVISFANASNPANWTDFLNGNASNPAVGWFHTYVDVYEAVNTGYYTMPDEREVEGNEIFENVKLFDFSDKNLEDFRFNEPETGNGPNNVRMDGKLAYDKFGIHFHFYGNEKFQRKNSAFWFTASDGTRDWYIVYQSRYRRKGSSTDVNDNGTLIPPLGGKNKLDKSFYKGSRGLKKLYARWDLDIYTNLVYVTRNDNGIWQYIFGSLTPTTWGRKKNYIVTPPQHFFHVNYGY